MLWRAPERPALLVTLWLFGAAWQGPSAQTQPPQKRSHISAQVFADKGQEHFYSIELADAVTMFKEALALEPENPDYWISLGHVYLFQMLERAGRLDNELYPASAPLFPQSPQPDPALNRQMWEALMRGRGICERRIAANPRDAEAHYFLGLSYAFESNYHYNLRREYFDALGPANKAREMQEKVRALNPANHDANLILGTHEYAIGSVPAAFRWVLRLAGYTGTKENGVKLVQDALLNGKRGPAGPLLMLAYIYNREKQYDYSRQMLAHLARFYPRNPHYELHIADSFRKQGNLAGALAVYQRVEKHMRDRAPGYDRVNAPRLAFQIGATLARLGQNDAALAAYRQVVAPAAADGSAGGGSNHGSPPGVTLSATGSPPLPASAASAPTPALATSPTAAPPVLLAHAWLRIGDLHRALAQKDAARVAYSRAAQFPFPEVQRLARSRLKVP
jgi:tetratricopeptide (TPR) repeat protein